jgi:hypothetical protein
VKRERQPRVRPEPIEWPGLLFGVGGSLREAGRKHKSHSIPFSTRANHRVLNHRPNRRIKGFIVTAFVSDLIDADCKAKDNGRGD